MGNKCQSTHINENILCGFNQFESRDKNVIHNVCGCDQTCYCNQCNDHIVGSQVIHDNVGLSEGTFRVNSVDKSTSVDNKYVKNTHVDFKFSHVTVIDSYRHIQTTGVNLVQCSHRNTSMKVPSGLYVILTILTSAVRK